MKAFSGLEWMRFYRWMWMNKNFFDKSAPKHWSPEHQKTFRESFRAHLKGSMGLKGEQDSSSPANRLRKSFAQVIDRMFTDED